MAIADMLVLRQSNETSGSPIECEHSDPSDQAILTRGAAFGKTLHQEATVLHREVGSRGDPDGREREAAMARRKNRSVVVRYDSAEDLRYGINENDRQVYEVFDDRVVQSPKLLAMSVDVGR